MKKILFCLFYFLITFNSLKVDNLQTNFAKNYIVIDAYTNEILEGKAYNEVQSVASISKIMTAIIAIESEQLFKVITVDEIINTIEGSSVYLEIDTKITIMDLVYALLLRSGNDAAVLIAKNISPTIDEFVYLMNEKAKELKLNDTIFNNPSGLDVYDSGNISSCYDMAKLMSYCIKNKIFQMITSTKKYNQAIKGIWYNKNKLLQNYEYCIGGKTGYTHKAKRTLITCSEKNYHRLIVVTFSCSNDFYFHKEIYEKYFNNFHYIIYLFKGKNYIDNSIIYSNEIIGLRIPKNINSGIKCYYINSNKNELTISFISKNLTINSSIIYKAYIYQSI